MGAYATPIYRKGDTHLYENNRPISVTPTLAKFFKTFSGENVGTPRYEKNLTKIDLVSKAKVMS